MGIRKAVARSRLQWRVQLLRNDELGTKLVRRSPASGVALNSRAGFPFQKSGELALTLCRRLQAVKGSEVHDEMRRSTISGIESSDATQDDAMGDEGARDKVIPAILRHQDVKATQPSYIKTVPSMGDRGDDAIGRKTCLCSRFR